MPEQMIERVCPVCGSQTCSELLRKESLRLVACADCTMAYASPVSVSLVTGEFYDQLATPFYLSRDKLDGDYAPVRFNRELKLFRQFCQQGHVLDVGCSTGAFLYQLKARFPGAHEVTGIDVAGPALDHAEKMGVRVMRQSFLTAAFQGQAFAAITFWAVMEHLVHPREFVARAASLLQPGGCCFILVPNFRSLAVRILEPKYRYIMPQHVNYFTPATLRRLAQQEPRLNLVHAGSMHFNPLVVLHDYKSDGRLVSDEERAKLLKRTTGYKQNPAMRPVKLALTGVEKALGWLDLADNIVLVLQRGEGRKSD